MTKSVTLDMSHFPDGQTRSRIIRNWEVQPKPYRAPLPFRFWRFEGQGVTYAYDNGHDVIYPNVLTVTEGSSLNKTFAGNRAYGKLIDGIGDKSGWGENFAEAHQAISTVEARAGQLVRTVNSLRKGDVLGAFKALGSPEKVNPGKVAKLKSVANQFLEMHFGWEPMLKDIHDSVQTMSKADFGTRTIHGTGSDSYRSYTSVSVPDLYGYFKSTNWNNSYHMRYTAVIRISNPNAFLANQFGVANPVSIAWELVPYSFVADWFSNVGQCLSAMTDFVGLDVIKSYTTSTVDVKYDEFTFYGHPNPNIGGQGRWSGHQFFVGRDTGLPGPRLALKPFKGFSPVRGATAISLLVQKLRG